MNGILERDEKVREKKKIINTDLKTNIETICSQTTIKYRQTKRNDTW